MKYADVEKSPLVGDGLSTRSGSLLCARLVVLTSKQLPQCLLASDAGVCVSHDLVASAPATCGRIRFESSASHEDVMLRPNFQMASWLA